MEKLNDFVEKQGHAIYEHRKMATGYISGTIRYEVFKRASGRCELCGVSNKVKALEVDHIIPRSKGGSDDLANFQALCYTCNSMKGNRDDTDFRETQDNYKKREEGCLFCAPPKESVLFDDELCYAMKDGYPVSAGHTLIIPKRHHAEYFDLTQPEVNAINRMLKKCREYWLEKDQSITGFNIGVNVGEDAGQTIFHTHVHLIPRRAGDQENPRGGVRKVFPEKADY